MEQISLEARQLREKMDLFEVQKNPDPGQWKEKKEKDGWSFVITTDGKAIDQLNIIIESIDQQFTDSGEYEIIIVGTIKNVEALRYRGKVSIYCYEELNLLPGWITRKKNLGVKLSSYDKVVVTHDYVFFDPGWKAGFDQFGNDFEVCVTQIHTLEGKRWRDWLTWDYPGVGPGLLPYQAECTKYQYISGTFFVVKRRFFLENMLNEHLRWGEGEDIEWSKRIRDKVTFKVNTLSKVHLIKKKPANDAPYCDSWMKNSEVLMDLFSKNKCL